MLLRPTMQRGGGYEKPNARPRNRGKQLTSVFYKKVACRPEGTDAAIDSQNVGKSRLATLKLP